MTYLWFVGWGLVAILCALRSTEAGSIAAIIAAVVVVISAFISTVSWIIRRRKLRNLFSNAKYWLENGEKTVPSTEDIENGKAFISVITNLPSQGKITAKRGNHHIYIEVSPLLPLSISSVNLRFLDGDSTLKPQILKLKDANQESVRRFQEYSDGEGGISGSYSLPMAVHKGRDVYYIATFNAKDIWNGKLSLRFYPEGLEARSVRVNIAVV
jgi:hypothetical protein